jgi:hypothetical protein
MEGNGTGGDPSPRELLEASRREMERRRAGRGGPDKGDRRRPSAAQRGEEKEREKEKRIIRAKRWGVADKYVPVSRPL